MSRSLSSGVYASHDVDTQFYAVVLVQRRSKPVNLGERPNKERHRAQSFAVKSIR